MTNAIVEVVILQDERTKHYRQFLLGLGLVDAQTNSELMRKIRQIENELCPVGPGITQAQIRQLNGVGDSDYIDQHFKKYYSVYDSWFTGMNIPDQLVIMEKMLGFIGNPTKILDVGCGPCHQYTYLLKEGLITSEVNGIDPLTRSLEEGIEVATKYGVRLSLSEGRIPAILPASGQYDFISCIDALHWSKAWKEGLSRMVSFLAPEGKLFIVYSTHCPRVRIPFLEVMGMLKRLGMSSVKMSTFNARISMTPRTFVLAQK